MWRICLKQILFGMLKCAEVLNSANILNSKSSQVVIPMWSMMNILLARKNPFQIFVEIEKLITLLARILTERECQWFMKKSLLLLLHPSEKKFLGKNLSNDLLARSRPNDDLNLHPKVTELCPLQIFQYLTVSFSYCTYITSKSVRVMSVCMSHL